MTLPNLKNFAIGRVLTAPSPATSGTTLVLESGQGADMPSVPFQVTIAPAPSALDPYPTNDNAEIATVTGVSSDTLTLTRAQEGTTARAVVVGDVVAATLTSSVITAVASAWDKVLDLPLSTGTDWAMPAGWTNDGTKHLIGVNTPVSRNKYNIRLPLHGFAVEVEIQMPSSSRSATDQRAGLLLNWDGTNSSATLTVLKWVSKASGSIYDEQDGVVAGTTEAISGGLALDTWHKLRVVRIGMNTSHYVNGTFLRTVRTDSHSAQTRAVHFIGLYGYQIDAWFRNLKVWTLAVPS
jgi:hypothetical protein